MASLLIVDDDRSVIHVFRRCFQNTEVTVLAAESAAAGMELIERCHPDVVILDLLLPDESGLVTFQQIHQKDPGIPVIFVTASGTSHSAIEAIKLGAFDYLLKPLDLAKIRDLVSQALKIRRLTHAPSWPAAGRKCPGGRRWTGRPLFGHARGL